MGSINNNVPIPKIIERLNNYKIIDRLYALQPDIIITGMVNEKIF